MRAFWKYGIASTIGFAIGSVICTYIFDDAEGSIAIFIGLMLGYWLCMWGKKRWRKVSDSESKCNLHFVMVRYSLKKIVARIFFTIIAVPLFSALMYGMYINPIIEVNGVDDKWYEYVFTVASLTIFYALMFLVIKGVSWLLAWIIDNA